jgi:predicted choloylglycine hydrolase
LVSKAFLMMMVTRVFLFQCHGVTKVVILQKKIAPSLAINKI